MALFSHRCGKRCRKDGAPIFLRRRAFMSLVGGADEILFQLAVGVGVGADTEAARGVDDAIAAIGHATAEHLAGLAKGERLAERAEAVFEVGEGLRRRSSR